VDSISNNYKIPEDCRVFAVGDIHGRRDLLELIYEKITGHISVSPSKRDVLVFLGDYVDRGFSSRHVIDFLLETDLSSFETHFLKGNHEDMMLAFLEEESDGSDWVMNGGYATLLSYGVRFNLLDDSWDMDETRGHLKSALPDGHLDFLQKLEHAYTVGGYHFVHAGVRPGVALADQVPKEMIWVRNLFLNSDADHGARIVHGHTIVREPEILPNRIGIDTGAFHSDCLTCLVLDGENMEFIQT